MTGKMERAYFDEKKELALDGIKEANKTASELAGLLKSWDYEIPDIINPSEIHESIRVAKALLDGVRRNFEKVRWSSASSSLEFDSWLHIHGHDDLIL